MFWKRWITSVAAGLMTAGLLIAALLAGSPAVDAAEPPAPSGRNFTLDSEQGPVSLGDLRGKVVMLFFGYTSCPGICPLSLSRIGACLSSLEAEQAQHVRGLFVTLDPERDTAERMHRYVELFHPGIIGLTGTRETIGEVTSGYGVAWERKLFPGSALGYTISHPDTVFLLDGNGELVGNVARDEGRDALRTRVLELLALGQ